MGWAVGYDTNWDRWIGYGVPGICDQPGCGVAIDRGLGYVCGGAPYGGDSGCGLFFCGSHLAYCWPVAAEDSDEVKQSCERCADGKEPFDPTPETPEWIAHILTDQSWAQWRDENPLRVKLLEAS